MSADDLDLILERSLIARETIEAYHAFFRDAMAVASWLAGLDGDAMARVAALRLLLASRNLEARTGEFAMSDNGGED